MIISRARENRTHCHSRHSWTVPRFGWRVSNQFVKETVHVARPSSRYVATQLCTRRCNALNKIREKNFLLSAQMWFSQSGMMFGKEIYTPMVRNELLRRFYTSWRRAMTLMCRKREEDCATLLEFQNYKLKRKRRRKEKRLPNITQ